MNWTDVMTTLRILGLASLVGVALLAAISVISGACVGILKVLVWTREEFSQFRGAYHVWPEYVRFYRLLNRARKSGLLYEPEDKWMHEITDKLETLEKIKQKHNLEDLI